jgi:hypothetical protein
MDNVKNRKKKWLICFCSHMKPSNNSFVSVIANILWHVVFYTFDITHRRYLNDLFCIWVRQGEKNNRLNMLMGYNDLLGSISEWYCFLQMLIKKLFFGS